MDLFTESVDSSLWFSRTYDDPAHDNDTVSAEEALAPITFTPIGTEPLPSTLLVFDTAPASALLAAHPCASLGTISGVAIPTIDVVQLQHLPIAAVCFRRPFPEHRATVFAKVLAEACNAQHIIVATSLTAANFQGTLSDDNNRIYQITCTANKTSPPFSKLPEPNYLRGLPAAALIQAELSHLPATCLTLVTERANTTNAEAEQLHTAISQVLATLDLHLPAPQNLQKHLVQTHNSLHNSMFT